MNRARATSQAFIWTNILNAPFWAIFNLLPFILYKDLHATAVQITAIIALKPLVSLISMYWSAWVDQRPDRLLPNVMWARVIGHLPFFLFPFIDNPWFFIASFGFYMMLARGSVPAWMEILKQNLPESRREKVFAMGTAFGYLGNALVPFAIGPLMDAYLDAWRFIFPACALLSLGALFFKARMTVPVPVEQQAIPEQSVRKWFLQPWKSAWQLLVRRPDFRRYQIGFMLGGSGMIIIQPALPVFFMDHLNLTYTELAMALTLCKGISFALASPFCADWITRVDIFRFNGAITCLAGVFPIFLLAAASGNLAWLYAGYFFYGAMQAGSEMSWNLSGPIFSRQEDSSLYSSVNVLTVGVRGSFVPALGSLLCAAQGSLSVLASGTLLCLIGGSIMLAAGRRYVRVLD